MLNKATQLKVLTDLISIPTVDNHELKTAQYLKTLLNKHGIKTQTTVMQKDRANLMAEIGTSNPKQPVLAFSGHQDTVAISNLPQWDHHPFTPTIKGDRLYGRGSADMKSGLAAEVCALINLKESNIKLKGTVRLLVTFGEENGAPGAYAIPNEQLKDIDLLIVGEATNDNVIYAHAGSLNYEIISKGKAVHSSRPQQGLNALTGLATYIIKEPTFFNNLSVDPILGTVHHSVTIINGGNQINTIPDYAYLRGNVRPTPSFNNPAVINLIKKQVALINQTTPAQLSFKLIHNFYPVVNNKNNPVINTIFNLVNQFYPKQPRKLLIDNGATDASVFVQTNPNMTVVELGPACAQTTHQVNEYTTISSYLTTSKIYQKISEKILS